MHEMSLALEICRIAEERVGTAACPDLVEVGVVVGRDDGVEPANLAFCLEALLAERPFGRARLALRDVPGEDLRLEYLEVDDGRPDD